MIPEGVTPSRHVDDKHTRIKQYHKEGRALRTETTINDAYDFALGRRLSHLSALRKVGVQANRRLLDVQRISHDCAIGDVAFARVSRPVTVAGQRAAALRFADPVVLARLSVLVVFRLLPDGWRHRDLGAPLATRLGLPAVTPGRMTDQLRRLRLHGLIARLPGTLSGHRARAAPGPLLHPGPRAPLPSRLVRGDARRGPGRRSAASGVRAPRTHDGPVVRGGETRRMKLDSSTTSPVLQGL